MANAKKRRTPTPPRQVQAPKARGTGGSSSAGGTGLAAIPRWGWIAGVVALAAAAAIVVALSSSGGAGAGGSTAAVRSAMLAAGCTYRDVPPKPPRVDPTNYHADFPTLTSPTKGEWSTSPPSGGGHYYLWAVWGFYTTPVNVRQVVHNEEHGAIVLWWGSKVPASTVAKLRAFYDQQPDGLFGTPYPSLGDKIALTSWTGDPTRYYVNHYYGIGHIAICPSFNQAAFAVFRAAFRGHGPEGIPLSDDEPGMGPTT